MFFLLRAQQDKICCLQNRVISETLERKETKKQGPGFQRCVWTFFFWRILRCTSSGLPGRKGWIDPSFSISSCSLSLPRTRHSFRTRTSEVLFVQFPFYDGPPSFRVTSVPRKQNLLATLAPHLPTKVRKLTTPYP